jgi:hypothetical protein
VTALDEVDDEGVVEFESGVAGFISAVIGLSTTESEGRTPGGVERSNFVLESAPCGVVESTCEEL